jgi:hypothetical protein
MRQAPAAGKPTVEGLGIDVSAQHWRRSGSGPGAIEIAFVQAGGQIPEAEAGQADPQAEASQWVSEAGADRWVPEADAGQGIPEAGADRWVPEADAGQWVLLRVAGDPAERVLVYDRFEWECFLDGAKNGEFDDAA